MKNHTGFYRKKAYPPSSPLPLSRLPWKTFQLVQKSTDFVSLLEPPSSLQVLS
jgi:hypothetical protein